MGTSFIAVLCFGQLALTSGNIVSPGLLKCLDLQALKKADETYETMSDMEKHATINVQMYKCHGKPNQEFEISKGQIRSTPLNRCLTATAKDPNSNVELVECDDTAPLQQWVYTGFSYFQLADTNQCLDVKAAKKPDGTYENFKEIAAHNTVNVHIYNCHDPETTKRVNQLFMMMPKGFEAPGAVAQRLFTMFDAAVSGGNGAIVISMSAAGAMTLFIAGVMLGRRRMVSAGQRDIEMEPLQ